MDETVVAGSATTRRHDLSPQVCDQLFVDLVGRLSEDPAIRQLAAWGSAELS